MTDQINYLNALVECIVDQDKWSSFIKRPSQNIPELYENTQKLLEDLQTHFNRCRKYNEAKIHRKYQIAINNLQNQNRDLQAKIDLELSARPSSQQYVSSLIDKMIVLQNSNHQLEKQNNALSNLVKYYEQKYEMVIKPQKTEDQDNPESKELIKKQWESQLIKQTAFSFLAEKKQHPSSEVSNFQKFLEFNRSRLDKLNLRDFFQKIDKWTQNLKDTRLLDKRRIKHKLQLSGHPTEDISTLMATRNYSTMDRTTPVHSIFRQTSSRRREKESKSAKDGGSFRLRPMVKSNMKLQGAAFQ